MSGRGGPRSLAERFRRLLIMLPWLMARRRVSVAEMAEHFQVSESELVKDLERASMCGLPPFVDEMIDLYIDEGMIEVGIPRLFTRPFRLTAPEGFGLLASARAAMELPGADPHGPLGRAIGKLSAVLGEDGVVVDQAPPEFVGALMDAAQHAERVEIVYWSPSRDGAFTRRITPRAVFTDRGWWYVLADDHASDEERTFRVDRIETLRATGALDQPRPVAVPAVPAWFADSDLPVVKLRLRAAEQWLVERYPIEHVHADGEGWVEVTLRVTSEAWLASLLLALGTRAELVEPSAWSGLRERAAAALAARYRTR